MKNLNELELVELNEKECVETEGGIAALIFSGIALCLTAYGTGYLTGKAIF